MPESKIINLIKELNNRIFERYNDFKGCYLYGSMVNGDYNKHSDIDLVAIFEMVDWAKDFEISDIICDLIYKYELYIDLHSYTLQELEQNPVYYNEVVNKGLFYAAQQ